MSFIVGEIEVALLDASAPPPNPGYDPPLSVARLSHEADADKGRSNFKDLGFWKKYG